MRLIACLSWFDEQPGWLEELVASLGRAGADHIVALDGAYAAYAACLEEDTPDPDQAHAILRAAQAAGMSATVHRPSEPWQGNELQKRTALLAVGHALATPYEDWLWICDGDEVITEAPNLRSRLEATPHDVASVTLWEGTWNRQSIRKLFRVQPNGITVRGHHACYLSGDGEYLWNPCRPVDEVPAEQLFDVRVQHRPGDRPQYRKDKRAHYYNVVVAEKLERLG